MKLNKRYRTPSFQKRKIEDLEESLIRFKRMYVEYEQVSDELKTAETSEEVSMPDDFIDAIKIQKDFLQNEIYNWLKEKPTNKE